jgi:hypothetical protein
MRWYPKCSGLEPSSTQQFWWREAPVDGRTAMSSESLCQVAHSWVDMVIFHTCVVGVMYVTCGNFCDGSKKEQ